MKNSPQPDQLVRFKELIAKASGQVLDGPLWTVVRQFLTSGVKIPDKDKAPLLADLCRAFAVAEPVLMQHLLGGTNGTLAGITSSNGNRDGLSTDKELLQIIPPDSFFSRYVSHTQASEAPLAYHVFCSLLLVGACMGRRVWFDMGYFRVFPPLGVVLLGPSGIKKTTSADIAVGIINLMAMCTVYSEKITPEALALSMSESAQGLIYAPEATVLMGKQKYNEGLIPLVTRLMDCPDRFTPTTIVRGATEIRDVACSVLMCSTTDWFIKNTPEDTFGGGFIARLLLVHQETSTRVTPIPKLSNTSAPRTLGDELVKLREISGEMVFTPEAETWYTTWYKQNKLDSAHPEHEILASYLQRKPIHLIRVAICFHVAVHNSKHICLDCLQRAEALLTWNESFLPSMLRELFRTQSGFDHNFVRDQVRAAGGVISHDELVRRCQYKISAAQLRQILSSLKEAKQVEEITNSLQHVWRIV